MSNTKSVSAERIFAALGAVDPSQREKLQKVFEEYEFAEELVFSRDQYGDGTISIPYVLESSTQSIPGLLRFREGGAILDGRQALGSKLSGPASRLLISSLFGEEELTKPLSEDERTFVEATTRIVNGESLKSVQPVLVRVRGAIGAREAQKTLKKCIDPKQSLVELAHNMLKVAEAEDEGPGGWDPDDFSEIVSRYTSLIATYSNSLTGCKSALQNAKEMVLESAATWSGARACVRLERCLEATIPCSAGERGSGISSYYYIKRNGEGGFSLDGLGTFVRRENNCAEERERPSHDYGGK